MVIAMDKNGDTLTVSLYGRLETFTSHDLEEQLEPELESIDTLIFDFAGLEYISSAGLRVLQSALKVMVNKGGLIVRNACPQVMEVFELTGFLDVLTIE